MHLRDLNLWLEGNTKMTTITYVETVRNPQNPWNPSPVTFLFKDEGSLTTHPLSCHPYRVFGCDTPNPGVLLITRQPVESCGFRVTRYHMVVSHLSGSKFPQKMGQSLLCSGSSTQHTTYITVFHKSLIQHSYT